MIPTTDDLDGGNLLLAALAPDDFGLIAPYLTNVTLRQREVLFDTGSEVRHLYFPHDCVVSGTVTMQEGTSVEAGTIGREGAVGFVTALGDGRAFARGIVQIAGRAARLETARLGAVLATVPRLRRLCLCHAQALFGQIVQGAACNALHPAAARLCRWLLMLQDRQDGDTLPLTQEFLAEMLAVQRTTVSLEAGRLQAAGLIRCHRGRILLRDRAGLEQAACECYHVVREHYRRLLPGSFA
jgi:CRP-like cAMP-binding protein